jgi:hypothetical protein
MSGASGQTCPSVHRFSGTATAAMARTFAACSRVRRTSSQPPRPQGAAQPAPTRTPDPGRASPACEPCHRSWIRTLVPSLPAVPSACPGQRIRAVTSGHDGSLRSVLSWPFGVGAGAALPRGSAFQARDAGSIPVTPLHRPAQLHSLWHREFRLAPARVRARAVPAGPRRCAAVQLLAPARGPGRDRRAALCPVVVPVRGGGTPPGVDAVCPYGCPLKAGQLAPRSRSGSRRASAS